MSDIKENKLRPYTIVTGQDVEKFEEGVNHLLELGYVPYGNVQTSSVLGKGDIITIYTQVMIESPDDCCDCEEHQEVVKEPENEGLFDDKTKKDEEKNLKEFLTEPANETKNTSKKKK